YQHMRLNLQRLAHVEFFANGCEGGWRVTPPILAVRRDEELGWISVLCGARSRRIIARLQDAIGSAVHRHVESQPNAPSLLRFQGSRAELTRLSREAGLLLQLDAPLAILGSLPPTWRSSLSLTVALPVGQDWKIERFSVRELRWKEAS